jgi:DNA polymerase-3 subunit delta'
LLIGHERQKNIFKNILLNNSLLNSYLFTGNEGVGKKFFATELARSALCKDDSFFEECFCSSCRLAASGNHPDIRIVDDESIKIDSVREFIADAHISPYYGKYKFYIINNAHTMTREAANSFLKTLEEPSDTTVFILVTHRQAKLLPTIRSRCVEMKFGRLTFDQLYNILNNKGYNSDDIEKAISLASGSAATSINLLEGDLKLDNQRKMDSLENLIYDVLSIKSRDDLKNYAFSLYINVLDNYKNSYEQKFLYFLDDILRVIKYLEYNVNLEMLKMSLISKMGEVLREET